VLACLLTGRFPRTPRAGVPCGRPRAGLSMCAYRTLPCRWLFPDRATLFISSLLRERHKCEAAVQPGPPYAIAMRPATNWGFVTEYAANCNAICDVASSIYKLHHISFESTNGRTSLMLALRSSHSCIQGSEVTLRQYTPSLQIPSSSHEPWLVWWGAVAHGGAP
jgi:hypothetical protein